MWLLDLEIHKMIFSVFCIHNINIRLFGKLDQVCNGNIFLVAGLHTFYTLTKLLMEKMVTRLIDSGKKTMFSSFIALYVMHSVAFSDSQFQLSFVFLSGPVVLQGEVPHLYLRRGPGSGLWT